jgi:hypothetical protein
MGGAFGPRVLAVVLPAGAAAEDLETAAILVAFGLIVVLCVAVGNMPDRRGEGRRK